jgi:hypothetical protein
MDETETGKMLTELRRIAVSLDRLAAAFTVEMSYKVKDEMLPSSSEVGETTIHVLQNAENLRQLALKRLVRSYSQGG